MEPPRHIRAGRCFDFTLWNDRPGPKATGGTVHEGHQDHEEGGILETGEAAFAATPCLAASSIADRDTCQACHPYGRSSALGGQKSLVHQTGDSGLVHCRGIQRAAGGQRSGRDPGGRARRNNTVDRRLHGRIVLGRNGRLQGDRQGLRRRGRHARRGNLRGRDCRNRRHIGRHGTSDLRLQPRADVETGRSLPRTRLRETLATVVQPPKKL